MLAFTMLGHMVFGNYIYKFSTISESFHALFRTILGDFDFHELERAHWFLGPAYFISYVMVVFFVLVNMFLAIINESYSAVKEEASNKRGGKEFQEVDFKRKIKNKLRRVCCLPPLRTDDGTENIQNQNPNNNNNNP